MRRRAPHLCGSRSSRGSRRTLIISQLTWPQEGCQAHLSTRRRSTLRNPRPVLIPLLDSRHHSNSSRSSRAGFRPSRWQAIYRGLLRITVIRTPPLIRIPEIMAPQGVIVEEELKFGRVSQHRFNSGREPKLQLRLGVRAAILEDCKYPIPITKIRLGASQKL